MKALTNKQKLERFCRVQSERDNLDQVLHAMLNDNLTWGEWIAENDGLCRGAYRCGICGNAYPVAVLVFRHDGQSDFAVAVQGVDELAEQYRKLRWNSDTYQPIVDAIASARQAQNRMEVAA